MRFIVVQLFLSHVFPSHQIPVSPDTNMPHSRHLRLPLTFQSEHIQHKQDMELAKNSKTTVYLICNRGWGGVEERNEKSRSGLKMLQCAPESHTNPTQTHTNSDTLCVPLFQQTEICLRCHVTANRGAGCV